MLANILTTTLVCSVGLLIIAMMAVVIIIILY